MTAFVVGPPGRSQAAQEEVLRGLLRCNVATLWWGQP